MIGNKIVDKITSVGKPKEKKSRRSLHTTGKKTEHY